jgi:hypothetical protein
MRTRTLPFFPVCILFVSFFLFFIPIVYAQPKCGFDHLHQQLLRQSPDFRQQMLQHEEKIRQWLKDKQEADKLSPDGRVANGSETIFEIPVVIHVMHTGGPEGSQYNPPDAQLTGMIDYLNQSFQATWATYSAPGSGGTRVPFRFVLAQRAPDCTPTTGIVRVNASSVADYASFGVRAQSTTGAFEVDLKALSLWPANQYYNIWIVSRIDGKDGYPGTVGPFIAGYAYFPGAPARYDGTIMLASQAVAGQSTLPHEMGHAFNLYHTFEGAADVTCPANVNCNEDGDQVCDTDPTNEEAFFTCPSAVAINPCTGNPWNGQQYNFMHYTSCADQRFTAGQRDRMIASVNTVRVGLLTSAALMPAPAMLVRPATCEPTSITFNENSNDMGPVRLQFNTLDDSSHSYTRDYRFYEDNTCNLGTTVLTGQTYTLSMSTRTNRQVAKAWIDFNDDGSFDATEQVMESYTPSGLPSHRYTHTAQVAIPTGAVLNRPLRLRVLADFINNNTILACQGQMYGQTEDYSVTILATGVLPVTIHDERIALENGIIKFSFKAGDEQEVVKYALQRAGGSGNAFTTISQLNPRNSLSSVNEYTATDELPTADDAWYRIMATQQDGSKYYSRILGKPAGNGLRNNEWRIYPNPTRGEINISLPVPPGLPVHLVLTDMQGRRVWTGTRNTEKPISLGNGLPPGMYYLTITAGQSRWNSKIIITGK